MELLQIIGVAFIATFIILLLKETEAEVNALTISLVVSIAIFLSVLNNIIYVIDVLKELAQRANINQFYLTTVLRIIGIAYIAEFSSQVCQDAGETALAGRIEFAGKVVIMVMAVPIIGAVLESIMRLLP